MIRLLINPYMCLHSFSLFVVLCDHECAYLCDGDSPNRLTLLTIDVHVYKISLCRMYTTVTPVKTSILLTGSPSVNED